MTRSVLVTLCFLSTCNGQEVGARTWELETSVLYHAGAINDAELGMANLEQAMRDPALLADVARTLRHPEGRAELVKLLANPSFQQQMKVLIDANGPVADFLTLEFYAEEQKTEDSSPPDALASLLLALSPVASRAASARTNVRMETLSDLKKLSMQQNPVVGYFDPLNLAGAELWGDSGEATIGWLRHAEIKHGRVAMAGFVGYCLHENGIRWPWALTRSLPDYSSFEGLSAPAVWDAGPTGVKVSILLVIGLFEFHGESSSALKTKGQAHYTKGGKPGYFPAFKTTGASLWDPVGFTKRFSEEQKAQKLNVEINNGRLAMLGLMSLVSEAKVPGAVPALAGLIKPYDGQPMAPFTELDVSLPFVKDMLTVDLGI